MVAYMYILNFLKYKIFHISVNLKSPISEFHHEANKKLATYTRSRSQVHRLLCHPVALISFVRNFDLISLYEFNSLFIVYDFFIHAILGPFIFVNRVSKRTQRSFIRYFSCQSVILFTT